MNHPCTFCGEATDQAMAVPWRQEALPLCPACENKLAVAVELFGMDIGLWKMVAVTQEVESMLYTPGQIVEWDAPAALDEIDRILRGE